MQRRALSTYYLFQLQLTLVTSWTSVSTTRSRSSLEIGTDLRRSQLHVSKIIFVREKARGFEGESKGMRQAQRPGRPMPGAGAAGGPPVYSGRGRVQAPRGERRCRRRGREGAVLRKRRGSGRGGGSRGVEAPKHARGAGRARGCEWRYLAA